MTRAEPDFCKIYIDANTSSALSVLAESLTNLTFTRGGTEQNDKMQHQFFIKFYIIQKA